MQHYFDHETLDVYKLSIEYVAWCEEIIKRCPGRASSKQHLDESSSSIPHNIAEGNGKWSRKDRKRFFEIACASALESASCLDVLVAKKRLRPDEVVPGKKMARSVVSMLTRMIINLQDTVAEGGDLSDDMGQFIYEDDHDEDERYRAEPE